MSTKNNRQRVKLVVAYHDRNKPRYYSVCKQVVKKATTLKQGGTTSNTLLPYVGGNVKNFEIVGAEIKILDACCGNRGFWFDYNNPEVLFVDKRILKPTVIGKGKNARTRKCLPDQVIDFRCMALPDERFKLVVFDPPHLFVGENSYMANCYGALDKITWKNDIRKGFSECFRVLKNDGILIFKWNEYDVPLKQVLELSEYKPLFGHPSGKAQKTHWVCFMKSISAQKNKESFTHIHQHTQLDIFDENDKPA